MRSDGWKDQHAHGEKDVFLSIARERGGKEGGEERGEGVDKVEEEGEEGRS